MSHKPFPVTLHHLAVELKLLYLAARTSQAGAKVETDRPLQRETHHWPSVSFATICWSKQVKTRPDQKEEEITSTFRGEEEHACS